VLPLPPPCPQHRHLPTSGPLFKSVSGELSNLRWDLPMEQYKFYWGKSNRKQGAWAAGRLLGPLQLGCLPCCSVGVRLVLPAASLARLTGVSVYAYLLTTEPSTHCRRGRLLPSAADVGDWGLLHALSQGLAGSGPVPRSKFIFDALYLPQASHQSVRRGRPLPDGSVEVLSAQMHARAALGSAAASWPHSAVPPRVRPRSPGHKRDGRPSGAEQHGQVGVQLAGGSVCCGFP
jgi:hypothetical protein